MKQVFDLTAISAKQQRPAALFAVTSLGIIDSLAAGALTPTDAIKAFFSRQELPIRSEQAPR
jgi:hypothetical protein